MRLLFRTLWRLLVCGALGWLVPAIVTAESEHVGLTSGAVFPTAGARRSATLFQAVPSAETGIVTENKYAPPPLNASGSHDPRVWADRYHEFEVGAVGTGVAIGDYDGDGRPDVLVVSKTESCRLFRNLGGWKFADVTKSAGVGDEGDAARIWKQGATFVDVNNDGRLDLYVCRFDAPNLLYINQGNGTFKDEAAARGLALRDASVMGAFCDYDRDGWLDVYVQTNLLNGTDHPSGQQDHLFRNKGDGTFDEVTVRAGIRGETQGHSATWWDFDEDGWPDLYVANDFGPADSLYRNNHDGTFTNVINGVVPHLPYSSMGADLGDINNDGRIDLFVADMAATTHQKDQRGMAYLREQLRPVADAQDDAPQYARNALYLNTGTGRMMEAACLAGIAATDWTWAVRFEDLDNDGRLDLFVTNGMHREVHNVDQLQRLMGAQSPAEKIRIEKTSPVLNEAHLAYRSRGDLQFEDVSAAWGLDEKGVSFGAAFGDFDGDGDLDLVYSNYQKGVTVLRNDSESGHRVIFALKGTRSNRFGVGATVEIETNTGKQVRQLVLARGVLSSSEPVLHFGLGAETGMKRVTVRWPSGAEQVFENLEGDRTFTVTEPAESGRAIPATTLPRSTQFTEVSEQLQLSLRSREALVDEVATQPLLPMRQNRRGPFVAAGDLNGDGRDDLVLGGTTLDPARVIVGGVVSPLEGAAAQVNDGPVLIFDANGDGANDVLLTRGGSSLVAGSPEYQPKLWLNDGHGGLHAAGAEALPSLAISAGAAAAADFDHDGRWDVFIGGRVLPGAYPAASRSALLKNRGGRFDDLTAS
ncbi:MAG: FG-GAP-like repeat-containing protein, partial [Opitutus sp.]